MEKYSYEWPEGMMDGYARIFLDDFCNWGKCFLGYGGCGVRRAYFDECKIWDIPKILKEVKKVLAENPQARIFLDTPNFFDWSKRLTEDKFQFQEFLAIFGRKKFQPYFSVQTTPRDLIYFVEREEKNSSLIRQAGIQEIWLGVESANRELRDKYSKPPFDNAELEEIMLKLQTVGITGCYYLIVSTDDTHETILETVDFVRRTKPAKICPFDAFHYLGGEHYVDWDNMRTNLSKVANYQAILKNLAKEVKFNKF
ncbi:hypothetical protein KJ761_01075 [Patescibacteria group bacterium]|nr:hypothetical protein [Patescibacteria group bacterium]